MVLTERNGGLGALQIRDVPKPSPRPGDVLVRVHASSVNDWEWGLIQRSDSRLGAFFGNLVSPKADILGCDIAGVVEAVGEGVTRFMPGDRVYGDLSGCGFGAFAEYACAPAGQLARMARGMSFEQAAAIPQAGMLAVQGLVDAGMIRQGTKLLVNGAGGGVGTFAVQLARQWGAEITAVDKPHKFALLRTLGAHHVIDYAAEDFAASGPRWDLILDAKTTRSPSAHAAALNAGGTYVTVGGDIGRLLQTVALRPVIAASQGKQMRVVVLKPNKDLDFMNEAFEAGRFAPVLDGTYELARLAEAFERFGRGEHLGKIAVRIA